ncbi:MAG: ribosomal protein L7/L12 [Anaerolineae bacterium]
MSIAIEVVIVVVGVALLVGFIASRMLQSNAQDAEKPKRTAASHDLTTELERLYNLVQTGALTHDEYQQLKERLISGVAAPASMPRLSEDWRLQVEDEIRANRKIEAIKLYREATGLGLKESKDAVEDIERNLRIGY